MSLRHVFKKDEQAGSDWNSGKCLPPAEETEPRLGHFKRQGGAAPFLRKKEQTHSSAASQIKHCAKLVTD
jgi:hypothetical protein